jgi:hypothetical protein
MNLKMMSLHQSVGGELVATYKFGGHTTCCQCRWLQLLSKENSFPAIEPLLHVTVTIYILLRCGGSEARISYCDIYHFICHTVTIKYFRYE